MASPKREGLVVGRHSQFGLILFDPKRHGNPDDWAHLAFIVQGESEQLLASAALWSEAADDVTDDEFQRAVAAYESFKRQAAAVPQATSSQPVMDLHLRYLEQKGKVSRGIRAADKEDIRRIRTCFECGRHLDSIVDAECNACGWMICGKCGACGCGR